MSEKVAELWRCEKCGTGYVRDVGRCGSLIPPCDGLVFRADPRSEKPKVVRPVRVKGKRER